MKTTSSAKYSVDKTAMRLQLKKKKTNMYTHYSKTVVKLWRLNSHV